MANQRQIKRRIGAANNISKITKAMEMVAASKMRKAQDQATSSRPYTRALQSSLQKVARNVNESLHPLLQHHGAGYPVLLLISTDKGLVGGLNNHLFKSSLEWVKRNPDGQIIPVGRKAIHFCQIAGATIHAQFSDLPEKITTQDIVAVTTLISEGFLQQAFESVEIIYLDFFNTLSQKVRSTQLLPIKQHDGFSDESMATPKINAEYTFEPNAKEILNQLLPYYLENTVFQAFLEARASEHSSRMVAMKNASENAGELVKELKLEFNKTRQASITSELLDITTASLTIN